MTDFLLFDQLIPQVFYSIHDHDPCIVNFKHWYNIKQKTDPQFDEHFP